MYLFLAIFALLAALLSLHSAFFATQRPLPPPHPRGGGAATLPSGATRPWLSRASAGRGRDMRDPATSGVWATTRGTRPPPMTLMLGKLSHSWPRPKRQQAAWYTCAASLGLLSPEPDALVAGRELHRRPWAPPPRCHTGASGRRRTWWRRAAGCGARRHGGGGSGVARVKRRGRARVGRGKWKLHRGGCVLPRAVYIQHRGGFFDARRKKYGTRGFPASATSPFLPHTC
jgi:hypothetical protein